MDGRTVRVHFKGGGDPVPFDNVCTSGHAVGVPPDDSVGVFDGAMILGVFWTDHNIVRLERPMCISASGCVGISWSSTHLSVDLDDDPMDGETTRKNLVVVVV